MLKKIAIGVLVLGLLVGLALAVMARKILTGDNVRAAIAAQVSSAIGQPVTIGSLGASIYPQVTMDLTDVSIGQSANVQLHSMHVGTDLRALISRRIEHAAVRIDGARIRLPLPELGAGRAGEAGGTGGAGQSGAGKPPVEIVSIDEIVLRNVEVVRGDRTLRGNIELVPQGKGVILRRVTLAADDTEIEMTGTIDSLAPIEGRVEAAANEVNFDRLLAFLSDFAAGSSSASTASTRVSASGAPSAPSSPHAVTGVPGTLTFHLTLGRATTGALALSNLRGTAEVTSDAVTFDPLTLGIFGGRYEGSIRLTLSDTPRFAWRARLADIDTAAFMTFAGSPNTISGTLAGTVSLDGTGLEMEQALRTARGTARIDIANGAIAGLALVRTIVLATSGRGGYLTSAGAAVESRGDSGQAERFSRLSATLSLANGLIRTDDLTMRSTDVDLMGAGTVSVANMMTKLDGRVQLSEELSKKGGTDLYRYAQEGGRVTLPVQVSGPISSLSVNIDIGQAATRAIRNRAEEEARKAIKRNLPGGLRGLFGKRPPGE